MSKVAVWTRYLRRFAARPWYLPLAAFLAAADLFVLIIPTDFIIISYVLLKPQHWVRAFLWISGGSAIGALALASILQFGGAEFLQAWFPAIFQSGGWESTRSFVQSYGALALAVISVSFLPQQPGVVIAALSGMALPTLFTAVFAGRVVKYVFFSWAASHAPRLLRKIPVGRQALEQFEPGKKGRPSAAGTAPKKAFRTH